MKGFIREHKLHLLAFGVIGAIGGYFTGVMSAESLSPALLEEMIGQIGSLGLLYLVGTIQVLGYGVILGGIGILLAEKLGLWKPITFRVHGLRPALAVSVIGGLLLMLPDLLIFSQFEPWIMEMYTQKPTAAYLIACLTYGGVIEEIMMRLFLMSLLAFLLWKLAARTREQVPDWCLVAANVTTALLFAAAHLPATAAATALTPVILLRCFLLNGGMGLLFGRLYRRHGIQYAMLAHAGCHVVSKLIWILFL